VRLGGLSGNFNDYAVNGVRSRDSCYVRTIIDTFESFQEELLTLKNLDAIQRLRDPRDWIPGLMKVETEFIRKQMLGIKAADGSVGAKVARHN
jgi:hypothetical protein